MRTISLCLLTILCLLLAVAPAMADTLYSNGPFDGNTWAWPINFGFSVSDSFEVPPYSNIMYLDFVYFKVPGTGPLATVDMAIGSTPFGTDGFFGTLTDVSNTYLGTNQFGYEVFQAEFWVGFIPWSGDGFITLSNASESYGGVYWDQNSGIGCPSPGCPSTAYASDVGSIPSESFTLTGWGGGWGTTPEPSSILLFGSGILGLAGVLRRKLNIHL